MTATRAAAARRRRTRPPVGILASIAFLALIVLVSLLGARITPHDPSAQRLLLGDVGPNATHWAGTDTLGRDIFSRVMIGSRTALVGASAVALGAAALAVSLGLLSGYLGGRIDSVIMRMADTMLALPGLLIAIVVVGVVGGGYTTAVLVLAALFVAPNTRIVRSAVLEQRGLVYVEAARVMGVGRLKIMYRHILPNIGPIVMAHVVLDFAFALVSLAGLSFLGLGVPPGAADWGRMMFENRNIMFTNPAAVALPAALLILTATTINMVGDYLYQVLSADR